jgi:hypothetical protein
MMKQVAFILLLLSSQLAFSAENCLCPQQVLGSEIRMVFHLKTQKAPLAAFDNLNNNYFVAWTHTDDFITYRVQGQLFTASGATITPIFEFDKNITARLSDVTYNSVTREFLISWITDKNLWTRQITYDGRSAGPNIRIANFAALSSVNSFRVIFNSVLNEYLAVYDISKGKRSIIHLQRLDRFGKPIRRPFEQAGYQFINPRAEFDPESNRYLLAWESQTFGSSRILYRTFNAFLQPLHAKAELQSPSNEEILPRIVYHPILRQWIVFFQDCFSCAPLRARAILADGTQTSLFEMGLGPVDVRDIRFNPRTRGFVVLYETFQAKSPQFARISSSFTITDRNIPITCQPARQTDSSSLLYNSVRGEFLVIWNFIDFAPSDEDVYALRIRAVPQGSCQR